MARSSLRLALAAAAILALVGAEAAAQDQPYDLLIRSGTVIDGSGGPAFLADVAVRAGRIAAVGRLNGASARRVIDARGMMVTPGFIDLHSHADDARPGGLRSPDARRRAAPNLVTQGVTTVVVNQDGRSPWPIAAQRLFLEERGIGPNAVLLVGHGTIRARVMRGSTDRPALPSEVTAMRGLLRQGLDDGASGLSAGLEYEPGRWSTTDELVALVRDVAERGGVYIAHQRSEGTDPLWYVPSQAGTRPPDLMDAVDETIEVGRRTGARVVASHIKARGLDGWGASGEVIARIERARTEGVAIYADLYPYTASGTDGDVRLIPEWIWGHTAGAAGASPARRLADALEDTGLASALRADVDHEIRRRGGAERIMVEPLRGGWHQGWTLADLATSRGVDPVEMALLLQLEGDPARPGGALLRAFSMAEGDIDAYARQTWVATASDAGVALPGDPHVHPRFYGTFPGMLRRLALDRGVVPIEHAIRSMTSLPAEILGLSDRGLVRTGLVADLVVFDPARVSDMSTFQDPHRPAVGVVHVWVGGQAVVSGAVPTGALPGRVLTPLRPDPEDSS
jgi:N-acyl-D-amino-acid deacylase